MNWIYQMVQIPPNISMRSKDVRGQEAAAYLQDLANQMSRDGWEFYRVDTVGVVTSPGCLGSLFGAKTALTEYFVVTFRRQRA